VAGSSSVDLVIVGAGAAGLAAARTAQELRLDFLVFEAMDRIGGRAHTEHAIFGVPWDRGCHWLHSGSINPMRELADRYGFRYRTTRPPWRMRLGDRWATEEERRTRDERVEEFYGAVAEAGAAGRDVPIASVVDCDDPAYPLFQTEIRAEWGGSPDEVSTLDAHHYRDTDENWPVRDGYGALVARHAEGIPVELSTPVWRIDWGGPRVKVTTPDGTVEAGAVVVTVSTNVLTAELIGFEPALPDWKLAAAEAVPLGRANKVAFGIEGRYLGVEEHTNIVVPVDGRGMMNFQLRPFGFDMANGYLAGPLCRELEEAGEAEMIATSLDALVRALGSEVAKHVTVSACSRWGMEPFILGAYGAAKPGQAHRRADLGTPLADRLFFAGEATSPEFFSTCHGAHLTGIEAVKAAAVALGRVAVG
jgi:monoamine oxidase